MATKKVAAKKKAAKKPAVKAIQMPKELTVNSISEVTKVVIQSPLNVRVDMIYSDEGWGAQVDFKLGTIDPKKPSYVCDQLIEILEAVVDYSDAQFADIVAIVTAVRTAHQARIKE